MSIDAPAAPMTAPQSAIHKIMVLIFSQAHAMNPSKRNTMEDVCVIRNPGEWGSSSQYTFVGVYDGHGGREMVDFLEHALSFHVAEEMEYACYNNNDENDDDIPSQLGRAFLAVDIHAKLVGIATSGATVAVCLIDQQDYIGQDVDDAATTTTTTITTTTTTTIVTANVGDTRIVLYRLDDDNASWSEIRMTTDHVPSLPTELARIEAAGGFVTANNSRVCGVLAISRSLGDQTLKHCVVARPCIHRETVITTKTRSRDGSSSSSLNSFLIVACDGFWDVVSDSQAGMLVREYVRSNSNEDEDDAALFAKETVADFLVAIALRRGTTDNVTIVVAWL